MPKTSKKFKPDKDWDDRPEKVKTPLDPYGEAEQNLYSKSQAISRVARRNQYGNITNAQIRAARIPGGSDNESRRNSKFSDGSRKTFENSLIEASNQKLNEMKFWVKLGVRRSPQGKFWNLTHKISRKVVFSVSEQGGVKMTVSI